MTVDGPMPTEWPLLFRGGAPWAGMGMDRAVPVGTAPFEWTFRMAWWGGVTEGELDPEGVGGVTHSLRAGGTYTHRFLAPGIYAPRLRYTDPAGRVWIQQGLVLVFDRAWLEPILQARWRDFLTALAQNDLDKAGKLVEVTRQDRFLPWREFLTPQQWKKVAAALGSEPLTWFGLEGYLATFRFGSTSEGIEFAPDQLDGGWRYYFREGHLLGALMYQGN